MAVTVMSEQQAYEVFHKKCEEAGLLRRPPALGENDALDGINDETTLRRFLNADKLDVEKAFSRYHKTCATREDIHLLEVYEAIEVADFEKARILYPHWSGRRGKGGNPICLFDISKLNSDVLAEYKQAHVSSSLKPSPALLRSLAFHECLTRFVLPLCTAVAGHLVTSCLYLVDISGFGIKQAWNLRSYAQDISTLLANDYPEMIEKVLVIGAPRYFNQIWKIIKGWIDPVTAAKIEIVDNAKVSEVLSNYSDLENIPKQLGGSFEFQHGMLPDFDQVTREVLGRAALTGSQTLVGPFKWKKDASERKLVVPVGSVGGERRDITEKQSQWY